MQRPEGVRSLAWGAFFLGLTAQAAQVLLLRDFLTVFSGNELTIGLVFAAWMLAFAAGAGLASRGAGGDARPTRGAGVPPAPPAGGLVIFAGLVLPLVVAASFSILLARPIFGVAPGAQFTLAQAALMALAGAGLPALGLGLCYGALLRAAGGDARPTGGAGGDARPTGGAGVPPAPAGGAATQLYVWEAVGSVVGGAALTLVLLTALPPMVILLVGAIGFVGAALRVSVARESSTVARAAGLLLAALGALAAAAHLSTAAPIHWKGLLPDHTLVRSVASPHGEIAVLTRHEQYDVFQSGHLLFSLPDQGESAPVSTLFLLQHPAPRSICLIGGAVSGPLKDLLAFPGVTHVDAVEFDGRVPEVARAYAGPDDQAALLDLRTRLHRGDARRFLQRDGGRYDLIICLLPEPDTIQVNRFYTSEFFRSAHARLSEGGVLAIGPLASSGTYVSAELLSRNAAVWRTLRGEFHEVAVTPGTHLFLIACDTPGRITLDENALVERLQKAGVKLVDIFPYCESFYVEKVNRELAEDPGSTRNTDDRPLGAYQSLRVWAKTAGGGSEALAWIEPRAACWPVVPGLVMAMLLGCGVWRARRVPRAGRRGAAGALIFVAGFAGMALELAIFHRFQTAYGAVYGAVGALVALFLGGIAIGGWGFGAIMSRFARRAAQTEVCATNVGQTTACPDREAPRPCCSVALGLALALWAFALPHVVGTWDSGLGDAALLCLFGGAMLLTGALVGALYPAVMSAGAGGATDGASSLAGRLYALDLAGGALGAILAGTVLIPLAGVGMLCVDIAFLVAATSVAAGIVSARSSKT